MDWSFGEDGSEEPKSLDSAMREIGALFKLNLAKQNNTYVFSGPCDEAHFTKTHRRPPSVPAELWTDLPKVQGARSTAVFFAVPPIVR